MSTQLALAFKLDAGARLDDYVGDAPEHITDAGVHWLSGDPGTGKSHLLQGICREAHEAGEGAMYLPNPGLHAPGILEGLDRFTVVGIDDIDSVIGERDWQVALLALVNAINHKGGKLVLASRSPLPNLRIELADLDSRLRAGNLVKTPTLDDDQRREVVRKKASRRGFEISEEVCRFILHRANRDMHHLETLVATLDRETLRQRRKVTIPFAKKALGL